MRKIRADKEKRVTQMEWKRYLHYCSIFLCNSYSKQGKKKTKTRTKPKPNHLQQIRYSEALMFQTEIAPTVLSAC